MGGGGGSGGAGQGGSGGSGGMMGECNMNNPTCADQTTFCDYKNDTCGRMGTQGKCGHRPTSCGAKVTPACGCDGKLYDNPCLAGLAGVDIDGDSSHCTLPPGQFACGPSICDLAAQYCEHTTSDMGGPDLFQCLALPLDCQSGPMAGDCACLTAVPCGMMCVKAGDGSLQVNCPGG
jgi:hypothetical protein